MKKKNEFIIIFILDYYFCFWDYFLFFWLNFLERRGFDEKDGMIMKEKVNSMCFFFFFSLLKKNEF